MLVIKKLLFYPPANIKHFNIMLLKRHNNANDSKPLRNQNSFSIIAQGMKISGDIESENDIRIDGEVNGNIYCKGKLIIGEDGLITGDVHARQADVFGNINGNAYTDALLCLKSGCVINGNLTTGKLEIAPDAVFNGQCTMKQEKHTSLHISEKALSLEAV